MADWIDTHAHLDDDRLARDLPAVLARCKEAGLVRVLVVATTKESSEAGLKMAAKHNDLLSPSVGIHPNNVAEASPGDWDVIVRLASTPGVVALGETGLDRYWDKTPFAQQQEYFARHLALSRSLNLPVIIHCRDAEADLMPMLRDDFDRHGPLLGVMHSFCADLVVAQACLNMGLHISFSGMLTYKNADNLRATASRLPLDRLLVETDCPYLTPVPHRGKTNEPAFVVHTGACLATAFGLSADVVASETTTNARKLFRFP